MRYLPHTQEDIAAMLAEVGAESFEDLFSAVPEDCRRKSRMNLPKPVTEWELDRKMAEISGTMAVSPDYKVYAGAGSYEHYIPASVSYLLGRGEFVTSYTPYQPEMSQGTLQAIYEYQTLTARLLGMEVANASMYDGASALAEALLMAVRITKKNKVAVSKLIHPNYRRVVDTYFLPTDFEIVEIPYLSTGQTDFSILDDICKNDNLAAVAVQTPNFFGAIEDLGSVAENIHDRQALLVACASEPLAYGFYKNPGKQGADIVCAEGQSLGVPRSFGGPGLGMFASKMVHVRSMPGRLVGKTVDLDGQRGFVLTLSTREQHIRREKATSNICTNHSLCALSSVIYMASLGGSGIRELARLNYDKTEYLKNRMKKAGVKIAFENPTFNEFVVKFSPGFEAVYEKLLKKKIVAGIPISPYYPELPHHYLFCVTETKSRKDMDELVKEVA
ncbi:MAG: aminomethyl-transferring glycine dehydrogenase subunit GcvPA [Desulfobacterales bacterium]